MEPVEEEEDEEEDGAVSIEVDEETPVEDDEEDTPVDDSVAGEVDVSVEAVPALEYASPPVEDEDEDEDDDDELDGAGTDEMGIGMHLNAPFNSFGVSNPSTFKQVYGFAMVLSGM